MLALCCHAGVYTLNVSIYGYTVMLYTIHKLETACMASYYYMNEHMHMHAPSSGTFFSIHSFPVGGHIIIISISTYHYYHSIHDNIYLNAAMQLFIAQH